MTDTLVINEADIIRSRQGLLDFFGGIDAKRPTAWVQYGYKADLTFTDYLKAYERGGLGHGAVHQILDGCWSDFPRIKEPKADKPTPWEEATKEVLDDINGWQKLMEADRCNMVGRYSAVIYRVADGRELRDPMATAQKLVDLVPVYESQIKVTEWDSDKNSPTYGEPKMYQFRQHNVDQGGDNQGQPAEFVDVHPTRVQILAEGSVGGAARMFDGVPLLKAGYNALVDVEKLSGGGAESALKNSARVIVIKFDKDADLSVITKNADGSQSGKTAKEVIKEQTESLNRNQDASMALQGGEATTLQTQVSDLSPQFGIACSIFAASISWPMTILIGQQTGRLASDEDQKQANKRCSSRRKNLLTPFLKEFVKRMQAAGIFETKKFEIEWPDLGAPTDDQRLDNAGKMATASKTAFDGGLTEPLFDANEIRKVAGFEPRKDDGMPTPEELEAGEEAEKAALAAKAGAKPGTKAPAKP